MYTNVWTDERIAIYIYDITMVKQKRLYSYTIYTPFLSSMG